MKTKLAFYKGKGSLSDKLIRWWTKSEYSHVELVVGRDWYSISPRDTKLRCKQVKPNPEHWDYVEVEIDKKKLDTLFKGFEGCGYDWLGIVFSQFIPLRIDASSKLFCSEWCAMVLGFVHPEEHSPQDLYELVS